MNIKELRELLHQLLVAFIFIMILLLGGTVIYLQGTP